MKVLINTCYGGFGLSKEFKEAYPNIFPPNYYDGCYLEDDLEFRTNPELIAAIEEFGTDKASDRCAQIVVAEIPENVTDCYIDECDGAEDLEYVLDGKLRFWEPDDED